MRYILNERFELRGWEKLPYAVADRKTGRAQFITAQEMDALKLCSGKNVSPTGGGGERQYEGTGATYARCVCVVSGYGHENRII